MVLNEAGYDVAIGLEGVNGRLFIVAHETTVAFYIRTEDGGQLAFHIPSYWTRLPSRAVVCVKVHKIWWRITLR